MSTTKVVWIALSLSIASFSSADEGSWEKRRDRSGVQVHHREADGLAFPEFRGVGHVDASLDSVARYFEDVSQLTQWMHLAAEADTVETEQGDRAVYVKLDLPPFTSDRDFVVHWNKVEATDRRIVYRAELHNTATPERPGVVRMPVLEASWTFEAVADGVQVSWQQRQDFGGFVPEWAKKILVVDVPHKSLVALGKAVAVEGDVQRASR